MAVVMLPGLHGLGGRRRSRSTVFGSEVRIVAHLRDAADRFRLQLAGVPAAADGRRARPALQALKQRHPDERAADLRAVLRHADHDPADRVPHRPDRRLRRRRRSANVPEVASTASRRSSSPSSSRWRTRSWCRWACTGRSTRSCCSTSRRSATTSSRARWAPGTSPASARPPACCSRLARARHADAADRHRCPGRGSARRHLRAVALRHPPAVQADLPAHAGRLLRRRPHHRHRRRREDQRLRVHLAADHPGVHPIWRSTRSRSPRRSSPR